MNRVFHRRSTLAALICLAFSSEACLAASGFDYHNPATPAWNFGSADGDASLTAGDAGGNVYFGSGKPNGIDGSNRHDTQTQSLTVDGTNLSGHYINGTKKGTANIRMRGGAQVDFIELGGAFTTTNTRIDLDGIIAIRS